MKSAGRRPKLHPTSTLTWARHGEGGGGWGKPQRLLDAKEPGHGGKGSGMVPRASMGWGGTGETERAAALMLLFFWDRRNGGQVGNELQANLSLHSVFFLASQ